jgi:hypothetical protein
MPLSGVVNAKSFKDFLVSNNLPLKAFISEDATAVVGRREYVIKLNSVIGFSLPLGASGLPDGSMSVVKSAVDIVKMFQNYPRATVCMIVMAQPLADGMPPMRLCSFGSDNRFTSCDVKNRLKTVQDILKSEGIEVTGYSADGDSRELKVMRQMLQLGVKRKSSNPFTKKATWFAAVDSVQCIPYAPSIRR